MTVASVVNRLTAGIAGRKLIGKEQVAREKVYAIKDPNSVFGPKLGGTGKVVENNGVRPPTEEVVAQHDASVHRATVKITEGLPVSVTLQMLGLNAKLFGQIAYEEMLRFEGGSARKTVLQGLIDHGKKHEEDEKTIEVLESALDELG